MDYDAGDKCGHARVQLHDQLSFRRGAWHALHPNPFGLQPWVRLRALCAHVIGWAVLRERACGWAAYRGTPHASGWLGCQSCHSDLRLTPAPSYLPSASPSSASPASAPPRLPASPCLPPAPPPECSYVQTGTSSNGLPICSSAGSVQPGLFQTCECSIICGLHTVPCCDSKQGCPQGCAAQPTVLTAPSSTCHQPLTAPSLNWPPADVYNGGCGNLNPFRMSCAGSGARFEGLLPTASTSIGLAVSTTKCACCLLRARPSVGTGSLCAGCCDGCNGGQAGIAQLPTPHS